MKKKLIVMAIMLALALPISTFAQGGLFQRGDADALYYGQTDAAKKSMLLRDGEVLGSLSNQGFGNPVGGSDLTNETFGTPIGSGLLVMLMAGAGYAALKTNKKTNKK